MVAQNDEIDSLTKKLEHSNEQAKGDLLSALALAWVKVDTAQALAFSDSSIAAALKNNDSLKFVKSSLQKALVLRRMEKFHFSKDLISGVIPVALRNKSDELGRLYNMQGLNYTDLGDYARALEFHLKALVLNEAKDNKTDIAGSYINIGLVYYKLKNIDKALEYYQKAVQLKHQLKETSDMDLLLINMGLCYGDLKEFSKALEYIEDGLLSCQGSCSEKVKITGEWGLGATYYNMDDKDNSFKHLNRSYELAVANNDNRYQAECLVHLARLYLDGGKIKSAESALTISEGITLKYSYNELLLDVYRQFATLYTQLKDYKTATDYQAKFVAQRDKLYGEELLHQIAAVQVEFEERHQVKKIQEQNELMALQEHTLKQERIVNVVIGIISILLLVVLGLLYKNYRTKKRMNQELDRLVQEKTADLERQHEQLYESNLKLASFVQDTAGQFKAPLSTLRGICYLGKKELTDEEELAQLEEIEKTVEEISKVIEPLTNGSLTKDILKESH